MNNEYKRCSKEKLGGKQIIPFAISFFTFFRKSSLYSDYLFFYIQGSQHLLLYYSSKVILTTPPTQKKKKNNNIFRNVLVQ